MKLTHLPNRRGELGLAVVSRDLTLCQPVEGVAHRLTEALAGWADIAPRLAEVSHALEAGAARHAWPFPPRAAQALPGADGTADRPRGGGAAVLLVQAGPLPARATPAQVKAAIRLVAFGVAWGVRAEGATRIGAPPPGSRLAPVAVTPDELAGLWADDGSLHLAVRAMPVAGASTAPDTGVGTTVFDPVSALLRATGEAAHAAGLWCVGARQPGWLVGLAGDGAGLDLADAQGGSLWGALRASPPAPLAD